jgi:magnesium-transporting ATPase (P-type)
MNVIPSKNLIKEAEDKRRVETHNNETRFDKVFNWLKIISLVFVFLLTIFFIVFFIMKYFLEMDILSIKILLEKFFYHLLSIGIGAILCIVISAFSSKNVK